MREGTGGRPPRRSGLPGLGAPAATIPAAAAAVLAAVLAAMPAAADSAGDRARDPALQAIAEGICRELMESAELTRQLNAYQLVALVETRPAEGAETALTVFDSGTVHCRSGGRSAWATFTIDGRHPLPVIGALTAPPAGSLVLRFSRVAPPGPAEEPDRLTSAVQAAEAALPAMLAAHGATPAGPPSQDLSIPGGPQLLLPAATEAGAADPGAAGADGQATPAPLSTR